MEEVRIEVDDGKVAFETQSLDLDSLTPFEIGLFERIHRNLLLKFS